MNGSLKLVLSAGLAAAAAGLLFAQTSMGANDGALPADASKANATMMGVPGMPNMRMPLMDPERGRLLFVSKGCVACHSVNGVGGRIAGPLDAGGQGVAANPFDLSAKMWNLAPTMIAAQKEILGRQITFSGDELASIVAFLHDAEEQREFSRRALSTEMENLILRMSRP